MEDVVGDVGTWDVRGVGRQGRGTSGMWDVRGGMSGTWDVRDVDVGRGDVGRGLTCPAVYNVGFYTGQLL